MPAGAAHVDLTGKTVMPAMINAHVHIGYEGYTSWGAANYTPENVLDHLQREAFYGVGATQSVGSSPTDAAMQFQQDQQAGKFRAGVALFLHARHGAAQRRPRRRPDGGAPTRCTSSTRCRRRQKARAAVADHGGQAHPQRQDLGGRSPRHLPEDVARDVYNAIIDEAHAHQMLVNAHAIALADQKAVVRDGADVLVHIVADEKLDEEFLAMLREKKPYWATVIGLGDRSEACEHESVLRAVAAGGGWSPRFAR